MWARFLDKLTTVGGSPRRRGSWGMLSWHVCSDTDAREFSQRLRLQRARYHLGKARRAREAGKHEAGVVEARRALNLTPANPWALSVLGQCLLRQSRPDLAGARRATEQAWALDPTNGYFVRLLLDVLDAQGDIVARAQLLDLAWWKGAPVERWWGDGRVQPVAADRTTAATPQPAATTLPATGEREAVPA